MPKKITWKQQLNAGFVLAMAFLLVFASNRINRRNFSKVEQNVSSVFEDRVVAQEYIHQLNNLFHKKELLLAQSDWSEGNWLANSRIEKLIADFGTTSLTKDEAAYFGRLQENYSNLLALENSTGDNLESVGTDLKEKMRTSLKEIGDNLNQLSEVQLTEGRQITELSRKSLQMNQLLSRLEIAFLIVIGILFVLIIFHREKPAIHMVGEDT